MSKRIYVPKPVEKGFEDPIIANKKEPEKGFEVPVFKDKPVVKPVVKTSLPTTTKTDLEKP